MFIDGYILLIGGGYNSMDSYSPFDVELPKYTALPVNYIGEKFGSRAALLENFIYSCGGSVRNDTDRKRCYRTEPGQLDDWSAAPDLKVSFESFTLKGLTCIIQKRIKGVQCCIYAP